MRISFLSLGKISGILFACLLCAGCLLYRQPIYQGNLLEAESVEQLQVGMSQQQVLGLLGTPSISDPFHQQRWDYTTSQRIGRTGDTEVKTLTLWFENGALARWDGEYFPEQDQKIARSARSQFGPNLAQDDED